jgi:N-acetylglutamate synthase-like GNAT family acetyltransferase
MGKAKIREASESDAKESYRLQEPGNISFAVSDFKESAKHKDAIYLVAEKENEVVGYVMGFLCPTKRTDCMLAETRVNEPERKHGMGSELVDAFCRKAFEKGAKTVYAEVCKRDMRFYDKNRFKKTNKWIEMSRKSRN